MLGQLDYLLRQVPLVRDAARSRHDPSRPCRVAVSATGLRTVVRSLAASLVRGIFRPVALGVAAAQTGCRLLDPRSRRSCGSSHAPAPAQRHADHRAEPKESAFALLRLSVALARTGIRPRDRIGAWRKLAVRRRSCVLRAVLWRRPLRSGDASELLSHCRSWLQRARARGQRTDE